MKKAAIYIRSASTRGQDVNLTDQRASAEAFAAMRGWTAVDVFTDAGCSANRVDRPGLTSMLAKAQAGAFDVLIVEDLQRLARKPEFQSEVLQTLAKAGVAVWTLSGLETVPALTSQELLALVAAHWKRAERIKRQRAAAARKVQGACE